MNIQDCFKGQRVISKETGKPATIRDFNAVKNEVLIEFDSLMRTTVSARVLEPAIGDAGAAPAASGPARACPQCAAKMPLDVTTCPVCGFQYGVKQPGGMPAAVKLLIALVVLGAIAFVVWKFVLHGNIPGL